MRESLFVYELFTRAAFERAARAAVKAGFEAVAIFDSNGHRPAVVGASEARAIAAQVMSQPRSPGLVERLARGGETLTAYHGDREARIGIAEGVFFVAVLPQDPAALSLDDPIAELRARIESIVRDAKSRDPESMPPPPTGSGGSTSGPAELPVVEVGVTVPRRKPN